MTNLRAGLVSGLIAVLITSATNIAGRLIGLLPDAMDIKYMAELVVNPVPYPTAAFWIGLCCTSSEGCWLASPSCW